MTESVDPDTDFIRDLALNSWMWQILYVPLRTDLGEIPVRDVETVPGVDDRISHAEKGAAVQSVKTV